MIPAELLKSADQAFASGDNQTGLSLLREFVACGTAAAGDWHRLAVVEEQVGDWALAGQAHYQCIELVPHFATGYIYAGSWLEQSGQIDAAVAMYSLAQEADPGSLVGSASAGENQPTQMRAVAANHLLRKYLSDQHRSLFTDLPDAQRIQNAIWLQTHDAPVTFVEKQFSPDLFYIPELVEKPFYETDEFEWSEAIEAKAGIIKNELSEALNQQSGAGNLRPYLPAEFNAYGPLKNLAGSPEWSALDLFREGQGNDEVMRFFPQTLNILKSIPTYSLDQQPVEVFFSLLKPRQQIARHYGQSNHSLTVHLALDVPDKCYLEVAGEKREWREGQLLIFNDSYLHSAHNPSEQLRSVLIFSVWHPALTDAEQYAIRYSFKTRELWMGERRSKLQQLLK